MDKTRLTRDKSEVNIPVVVGQCASKVLWSAIPAMLGDGEPCDRKGTRDIVDG